MTGTLLEKEECRLLGAAISNGGLRLERLVLTRCHMPSDGIKDIMMAFRDNHKAGEMLEYLDLSREEIRPGAIRGLCLPRLRYLDLSADVLGFKEGRAAHVACEVAQSMLHGYLPSLRSLFFHKSSLPDRACENLAEALASDYSPSLEVLEVDVDYSEGEKGWRYICEGIKRGPSRMTIKRLRLTHDEPSEDALRAVGELLVDGTCGNLIDVDLHASGLDDSKLAAFLDVIKHAKDLKLKRLNLGQNNLSSIGVMTLVRGWEKQKAMYVWDGLEEINLEDNGIDDKGGIELAR